MLISSMSRTLFSPATLIRLDVFREFRERECREIASSEEVPRLRREFRDGYHRNQVRWLFFRSGTCLNSLEVAPRALSARGIAVESGSIAIPPTLPRKPSRMQRKCRIDLRVFGQVPS
jgi:hypothetical protein